MAWITITTQAPISIVKDHAYKLGLEAHGEPIGGGEHMFTFIGNHSRIVVLLADMNPEDDMGLNWLVNQIQLEDESMDEHNATAAAVGL